jgi:hypothetical protein
LTPPPTHTIWFDTNDVGKCYSTTQQQLRDSISRLRTLNEVPERPKENILISRVNSTHRLSISRENEIAGNLAFLSATSDNSLKVMAVCVEWQLLGVENPGPNNWTAAPDRRDLDGA